MAPREDLTKYGPQAVKDGKITQKRLDQLKRMEAAGTNSIDGLNFFSACGKSKLTIGIEFAEDGIC